MAATTSPPIPSPGTGAEALAALQAVNERLARWQTDGTLDRLFALAEGVVGVADAVSDRMLGSAGTTLIGALSVLDWVAQDERRRDTIFYLIDRVTEWRETGALETLVTLLEGAAGAAQATTDHMVAHAGSSAIGWIRFVESLPEKETFESLVASLAEAAPALATLSSSLKVLAEPGRQEKELATIPTVSGIFSLGRVLKDPEIQRGVRLALLIFKQMGRTAALPRRSSSV